MKTFAPALRGILDGAFSPRSPFVRRLARLAFGGGARIRLYRKLGALMDNGVRMLDALESIRERAERKSKTETVAVVLLDVMRRVRNGATLAQSLRDYAPMSETMLIEAGENGGQTSQALELCAEQIRRVSEMRRAALGALVQPVFLLCMVVAAVFVVGRHVVPQLALILPPDQWRGTAAGLYAVSRLIDSWWFFLVLAMLGGVLTGIVMSMSRWTGRARVYADRIPPWSLYRLVVAGGWLLSLSSLVRAGVKVVDAIREMRKAARVQRGGNPWLCERMSRTLRHLEDGKLLGDALDAAGMGFPDPVLVDDLVVYSRLPGFENNLYRIGQEWLDEGLREVKRNAGILNAVSMLLMGCVAAWFALSVVNVQMQIGAHLTGN